MTECSAALCSYGSSYARQKLHVHRDNLRCALAQNVYGHLDDPEHQDIQRGVSYLRLRPGPAAHTLVLACPPASTLLCLRPSRARR